MKLRTYIAMIAACTALGSSLASANLANTPKGVWIDHTGRGGVEIEDCGDGLCGRLVWIKDPADAKGCGLQIIGAAKPTGRNAWDNGWIYDPEDDRRYSVELTPLNDSTLRVVGYLGSKIFSETMIWRRAPPNLERCS